jgi:hypothetical protein
MLLVPLNGADVNVMVLALTVYAELGFWATLSIVTWTWATDATGRDSVNAVVDPLPLKKSTAGVNACCVGELPIDAI